MTNEIEKFLKMGAAYNTGSSDIEGADVDDAPFSANDVVKTHESLKECTEGGSLDDSGLYIRQGFQIRSGLRRGDLFVADFGDFRLVAFTGEGVIKDAA